MLKYYVSLPFVLNCSNGETHTYLTLWNYSICAKTIVPPQVMPKHTTGKPNKNEQNDAGRLCFNTNHCVINRFFWDTF